MLKLFLMHVDGYVGSFEVLQATCVIQMKVAHDNTLRRGNDRLVKSRRKMLLGQK